MSSALGTHLATRINRIPVGSTASTFLGTVAPGTLLQNESSDAVIYIGQTDVTPANGIAITPGNSAVWQVESLVWAIVDPATAASGSLMVTTAISNVTQNAPYGATSGGGSNIIYSSSNVPFTDGSFDTVFEGLAQYEQIIIRIVADYVGNQPNIGTSWLDDNGNIVADDFYNIFPYIQVHAFPVVSDKLHLNLSQNFNASTTVELYIVGVNGLGIKTITNMIPFQGVTRSPFNLSVSSNAIKSKKITGTDYFTARKLRCNIACSTVPATFTLNVFADQTDPALSPGHLFLFSVTEADFIVDTFGVHQCVVDFYWPAHAAFFAVHNASAASMILNVICSEIV